MLEVYVTLLLVPAIFILLWERVSTAFGFNRMPVYRFTSFIGTPIHELTHAVACVIFGMRITQAKFFTISGTSPQLGYVNFLYNPDSVVHLIGRLVQGIAPLIAGGAIAIYALDLLPYFDLPGQGLENLLPWMFNAMLATWHAAKIKAATGIAGLLLVVLVMTICLHAVPSISDIKIGAKALVITLIFIGLLTVGIQFLSDMIRTSNWPNSVVQWFSYWLAHAVYWIKYGMYLILFGAVSVLTLATLMLVVFVLIPSLTWRLMDQRNKSQSALKSSMKPSGSDHGRPITKPSLHQEGRHEPSLNLKEDAIDANGETDRSSA